MTYSMKIYAYGENNVAEAAPFFSKKFENSQDFSDFINKTCQKRANITGSWVWLVPVRTHHFQSLCKDLFLPAFFSVDVSKVENVVQRVLIRGLMFCLDVMTLYFRVITLIPRAVYNHSYRKETHPLYLYLKEQGVEAHFLSKDYVKLETISPFENSQGTFSMETSTLNFVELPLGVIPLVIRKLVLALPASQPLDLPPSNLCIHRSCFETC